MYKLYKMYKISKIKSYNKKAKGYICVRWLTNERTIDCSFNDYLLYVEEQNNTSFRIIF